MKRDTQKAILAAAGRYIRRQFAEFEPRIKAIESRPAPAKGDPGEPGQPGTDGRDGTDGRSVTLEEVRTYLDGEFGTWSAGFDRRADETLARAIDSIEKPKDGRDGVDGRSVTLEDVRTYLDAELATWALGFERRAQDILMRAIERIEKPKDGRDGAPGFDLEDLQFEDDGEGTLTLRFIRGDLVREHTMRLPVFIDRGVYRDGTVYRRGDCASFGGSLWICQQDGPSGKPGASGDWRLAVKKGRDGAS